MWNYLLTPRCIRKLERPKKQESTLFRLLKRPLFLATLIGIGMMAVPPWTYADLFVSNQGANNILRYDERTGEFLGEFIPAGSGGLGTPDGLIFGPDGNLYVGSLLTDSILRYDGITGDPLPSVGNSGATFVPSGGGGLTFGQPGDLGAWLVFGPDGNLFVKSGGITAPPQSSSVLRFDGTTGEFIDVFVSPGSGGLHGPRALVFGPDGNLYVNSNQPGPGSVLRYDGTTGAFIDPFVPYGSGGLVDTKGFTFRYTDPTTLAYVPGSRFHIMAASTAVPGTPFDVTLTALDPNGNIDTNYQGTVTFSTTNPDSGVVLPTDYTFTSGDGGDKGTHTFTGGVTLATSGNHTLIATDTVSGIIGRVSITVGR